MVRQPRHKLEKAFLPLARSRNDLYFAECKSCSLNSLLGEFAISDFDTDMVIIGAGAIGLDCARTLAVGDQEVIVLEAETLIASHTSSRIASSHGVYHGI